MTTSSEIVPTNLMHAQHMIARLKDIASDVARVETDHFDVTIFGRYVGDQLTSDARKIIQQILLDLCKANVDAILNDLKELGITVQKPISEGKP